MRFKARAPARAYVIRAREENATLDVIVGTFYLFDIPVHALINPALINPELTHLYICTSLVAERSISAQTIEFDVRVTKPLCQNVIVNKFCRDCPLKNQGS